MSALLRENRPLAFLGFGELGNQIKNFIPHSSTPFVVFDDNVKPNGKTSFPFVDYRNHIQNYSWVLSIGYKHLQRKVEIIQEIFREKGILKSVIHESSFISQESLIEQGVVIYPMCNIDKGVLIKSGVLINNSSIISHDSFIDEGTYLSPGTILSGNVRIGKACFLGSGTLVSNNVVIGDNVIIGIGTVVSKDIPDNSCVIGNPMKFLPRKINLS